MWFKAMGGYNSGYHYVKRRSFREKVRIAQQNRGDFLGDLSSSIGVLKSSNVLKLWKLILTKKIIYFSPTNMHVNSIYAWLNNPFIIRILYIEYIWDGYCSKDFLRMQQDGINEYL